MKIQATRYHDISCGHRVVGHEGKCRNLHGHNYRIYFTVEVQQLDSVGRVLDFSVIKTKLCDWLEENWDHKMLLWKQDPWLPALEKLDPTVRALGFNPTAENLAKWIVERLGPTLLKGTGALLVKCTIEETRKCAATYEVSPS